MLRVCKALQKGRGPFSAAGVSALAPQEREVRLPCCHRARAGRMALWMLILSQPELRSR